ncbi:tail fiber assembly protein [Phytobacter ursingii]
METQNWAFSPAASAFYSYTLKDLFDAAGTWPTDAVDISDDVRERFRVAPTGKVLGSVDGQPAWVDAPPPTHEEAVATAENTKSVLLDSARSTISLWQSELLLGSISDTDKASLTAWITYIKAVQAVDTSTAPAITWPVQPA